MGATTARRARVCAAGLIACGAVMILSASSAFATSVEIPYDEIPIDDSTTTLPDDTTPDDTTPDDTTPEETTATTVDDYAPGDPVVTETTVVVPGVEVADTVAAPATAAAAGELPRTGGSSVPLGLLGVGSVAGGSALLAAMRPRRRA